MKPGVRLKHLALGQGMGPRALELITAGVSRGIWVLLQNCHLLPKFMPLLEKALDKLDRPHKVILFSCASAHTHNVYDIRT